MIKDINFESLELPISEYIEKLYSDEQQKEIF